MQWLKDMRISGKLLIITIPLVALLIGMVIFSAVNALQIKEKTDRALYEELFVSTALILNADRDFYQALDAEKELISKGDTLDTETRDGLLADYEENSAQVEERITGALENVQSNSELYSVYIHEATGFTLEDLASSFMANYAEWKSLYDPATGEGDFGAKLAKFEEAREEINVMTEILENYAAVRSVEIEQDVETSAITSGIIVSTAVLLFTALAIVIIWSIRKRMRYVTNLSRQIAAGNLSVSIDPKMQAKDEIGQLTATMDGEVRKAFADIEQARIVSARKDEYQTRQVEKLLDNLKRLSQGNLLCDMSVDDPDATTQDIYMMFTEISADLHSSIRTIQGYIREMNHCLGNLAKGDWTEEIESAYLGDFMQLKESYNSIISNINGVFAEIVMAADQVAAGTNQVSGGSQQISQGAAEQASAIEELTATVAQIAEQTKRNAHNANEANTISKGAQGHALEGNAKMKALQTAMADINEASMNINKIIKVIDDIAFQTNILALNAAVEAARAGAHGKGFAVVAEEVRNLAARSAKAAAETAALIQGSMDKVEAGTALVETTANALEGIVSSVERTVALVEQIASASNDQASSITQVDKGIEQMSSVVQMNSATAQEAAAAAEELSSQAQMLKDMIARFRLQQQDTV